MTEFVAFVSGMNVEMNNAGAIAGVFHDDEQAVSQPRRCISPLTGGEIPAKYKFKPGQSGNPAGRPRAGLSFREWFNVMAEWTVAEVSAVARDKKAPCAKVACARVMLSAMGSGKQAGKDFDRIMDYTIGRPKRQTIYL